MQWSEYKICIGRAFNEYTIYSKWSHHGLNEQITKYVYMSLCCENCPFKLILLGQTVKLVEKWPMTGCLLRTLLIQLTHRRWWSSTIRMAFTFTEHLKGINDVSANTLTKFIVISYIVLQSITCLVFVCFGSHFTTFNGILYTLFCSSQPCPLPAHLLE